MPQDGSTEHGRHEPAADEQAEAGEDAVAAPGGEDQYGADRYDEDRYADDWDDEPREPYTRKRFLKELAVAAGLLAVGLPAVLLLAPDKADPPGQASSLAQPLPTPTVTASPAPTLDSRPVVVLLSDVEDGVAPEVGQDLVQETGGTAVAATLPNVGWTSGQPSLGTLAVGRLPGREVAMVLIQAGRADVAAAPGAVTAGASLVVDRLRAAVSGSTSITLVGPVPEGPPTAALLRVRDEVRQAARDKKVHFVDPVDLGLIRTDPALASRLATSAQVFLTRDGD